MIVWFFKLTGRLASEADRECVAKVLSESYGLTPTRRELDRVAVAARMTLRHQGPDQYPKAFAELRDEVVEAGVRLSEGPSTAYALLSHLAPEK